jgi:hypothetical protein
METNKQTNKKPQDFVGVISVHTETANSNNLYPVFQIQRSYMKTILFHFIFWEALQGMVNCQLFVTFSSFTVPIVKLTLKL